MLLLLLQVLLLVKGQSLEDYLDLDLCDNALRFSYDAQTQQLQLINSEVLCAECSGIVNQQQSPNTYTAPCDSAESRQKWIMNESSPVFVSSANDTGNSSCRWKWIASNKESSSSGALSSPISSLCFAQRGSRKVQPTTCAASSVSHGMPFCDKSLAQTERAAALTSMLTLDEKLDLWSPSFPSPYVARLNLKSYMWDSTCIHGPAPYHLSPAPNVTVTAHAINLGATFDLNLVAAISNMTAIEMRAVTQFFYNNITFGTGVLALGCDGGPLANSAHDPR